MPAKRTVKADTAVGLNATAASVLGFLAMGPQSGYELVANIESSIGRFWNVTKSQIYRELKTLEASGYARVGKTGSRERRPFTLTAAGRKAFDQWISRDPTEEIIRFPLLLTLFFGDRLPPGELARLLRGERARHEARRAAYLIQLPDVERDYPFPAKTTRFGIMYEEMVLAWFDSLADDGLL